MFIFLGIFVCWILIDYGMDLASFLRLFGYKISFVAEPREPRFLMTLTVLWRVLAFQEMSNVNGCSLFFRYQSFIKLSIAFGRHLGSVLASYFA